MLTLKLPQLARKLSAANDDKRKRKALVRRGAALRCWAHC
jgi:hypothetical protein